MTIDERVERVHQWYKDRGIIDAHYQLATPFQSTEEALDEILMLNEAIMVAHPNLKRLYEDANPCRPKGDSR